MSIFFYHVLTIENLRDHVLYEWETTLRYMRLYLRISHPYLLPIHVENLPRLYEEEALTVEGAESRCRLGPTVWSHQDIDNWITS